METTIKCPDCKERVFFDVDTDFDECVDEQEVICPCGCVFMVRCEVDINCEVLHKVGITHEAEERLAAEMADGHKDRHSGVLFVD